VWRRLVHSFYFLSQAGASPLFRLAPSSISSTSRSFLVQRRRDDGGRPGTRRWWREARCATATEGGQRLCDGGHHHGSLRRRGGGGRPGARRAGGGGRSGFASTVTTTEAQGGVAVEAKCATAVEQRPPSLTLRCNRWRHSSSLDCGLLPRQPNDSGHGFGRGDDLFQHGDDRSIGRA
jgi:hypothetical protein